MGDAEGEGLPACGLDCSETILVVEDEVLVRMMVAEQLRWAGYTVVEAANAHEALDVLRHDSVDVRLVLSDICMPGTIDGVGLARAIRSQYPRIRIVLTSGHLPAVGGTEHDGFFPKPYDATKLINYIKTLLP